MKRVVCLISPSLWRGDIKHATNFINTVWNENPFQILLITWQNRKNGRKMQIYWVFLPILLRKTRQRRDVTYGVIDELRRFSLSKSCPALCHKLIYHIFLRLWSEISLFHKLIYDIAPGSFLIGWDVAVRLWRLRQRWRVFCNKIGKSR